LTKRGARQTQGTAPSGGPALPLERTLSPWSGVRPVGSKIPTRLGSARTAARRWSGPPLLRSARSSRSCS
jgi:hypothetical protein